MTARRLGENMVDGAACALGLALEADGAPVCDGCGRAHDPARAAILERLKEAPATAWPSDGTPEKRSA